MIEFKYRFSSNILWYITSTFDMYLNTNYHVSNTLSFYRHVINNKYMHNIINEPKSTEFNIIVFDTLFWYTLFIDKSIKTTL